MFASLPPVVVITLVSEVNNDESERSVFHPSGRLLWRYVAARLRR